MTYLGRHRPFNAGKIRPSKPKPKEHADMNTTSSTNSTGSNGSKPKAPPTQKVLKDHSLLNLPLTANAAGNPSTRVVTLDLYVPTGDLAMSVSPDRTSHLRITSIPVDAVRRLYQTLKEAVADIEELGTLRPTAAPTPTVRADNIDASGVPVTAPLPPAPVPEPSGKASAEPTMG
jgi:hypothetical protein